jgi:hypothetical protein
MESREAPPTGSASNGTAPAEVATEGEPVLTQYGCTTTFATFGIDQADAAPYLPEGFSSNLYAVKTWSCPRAELAGVQLGASTNVVFYFSVEPPSELALEDASHYVIHRWVSSSPEVAAVFSRWNLGAVAGDVTLEVTALPAGETSVTTVAGPVDGEVRIANSGGATAAPTYLARYFGIVSGVVVNAVDIPVAASSTSAGGLSVLKSEGEANPFGRPMNGRGFHQYWSADAKSYDWIYVEM